ncbi:MAG: alpha/beta hydrolase [Betaproteobacteria bacterium]
MGVKLLHQPAEDLTMTETSKINLLLLPGLLNDARVFQAQIESLADIAQPTVGDLTVADTISEIAAEVLNHAPMKFALAGLSMGGYVALEIMRQAPQRVLGLALIDTSARADTQEAMAGRLKLMDQAESNFQIVLDTLMPKLVHPMRMKYNSMVDSIYSMGHRIGKDAFMRQQRAIMSRVDSRPHLSRIDCPTLVLCGRDDAIIPVEHHEEMAAAIAGSKLVVVDDCAHLSVMGQPERVSEEMREWLGRIPR